jgi:hypothetical protein
MHKEARKELRVRLKLVVLELATHLGVTKAWAQVQGFCAFSENPQRTGVWITIPTFWRSPRGG